VNESEWLVCTDTRPMWGCLKGKTSDRKLRLLACACSRRVWHLLDDERSTRAVSAAERYADGEESAERLYTEHQAALDVLRDKRSIQFSNPNFYASLASDHALEASAFIAAADASEYDAAATASESARFAERQSQIDLLRDVFGNPFLPVAFDPAWRTHTVTALAAAAYEERSLPRGTLDADRLAVLADALEDAGCTNELLVAHLREPSLHVRGCWAIDLLLGKE